MNRTKMIFLISIIILFSVLACTACGQKATTMHLVKTEGNVSVLNAKGKNIDIFQQMGLYSGYSVGTESESHAWIDLDSTKLTKLDVESQVEVEKNKDKLELTVHSGKLFFNVTQPLSDEESLEIRTSTMVVGIRGTCGWIEVPGEDHMRVYLIEGTVECSIEQADGEEAARAVISGGEMADMQRRDGKAEITVVSYVDSDIPDFVRIEAESDYRIASGLHGILAQSFLAEMEEAFAAKDYDRALEIAVSDKYSNMPAWVIERCYRGDKNEAGEPDGIGIAYFNNLFYYGSWENGKRSGYGISFMPKRNDEEHYNGEYSVFEGNWANNLPNGPGTEMLKVTIGRFEEPTAFWTKISGEFVDGLYNGRIEMEETNWAGRIKDFYGTAQNGVWDILDEYGQYLVDETGETAHCIDESSNHSQGLSWPLLW
jgi:hypothetical protein